MKLRILKNEPRELRVEVEGEGHTFCNLVQEALLEIKSVDFAGYNIPHPLVSNPIIYVRTKRRTMAVRAFERALGDLEKRLAGFKREYLSAVDLGTAKKGEAEKTVLGEATVSGILRTLRLEEGFHFFRGLGNSTGMVAISLTDFVEKMGVVDVCSVDFHFERQDSQKWIRDVVGDTELTGRIGNVRKETHGEDLRDMLVQIVRTRLEELTQKD